MSTGESTTELLGCMCKEIPTHFDKQRCCVVLNVKVESRKNSLFVCLFVILWGGGVITNSKNKLQMEPPIHPFFAYEAQLHYLKAIL